MRRRIAGVLIRLAHKIYRPTVTEIRYSGQNAGIGAAGLLDAFSDAGSQAASAWTARIATGMAGAHPDLPGRPPPPPIDWEVAKPKPTLRHRFMDWLELTYYGYGLGLLALAGAGIAAIFHLWWLAAPLLIVASALCWWFG